MPIFQTLARLRRGEMNFVLLAVFVALLILPAAGHAAPLPPQSCEAVLLWLQSDAGLATPARSRCGGSLLSLTHREPERVRENWLDGAATATQNPSSWQFQAPCPGSTGALAVPAAANLMSSHEVAQLNGVRTNRRLH